MSRFSEALRIVCEQTNQTRAELAKAAGISAPAVVNYTLGRRQPNVEALTALCRVLPPECAANLILARLRDECPPEFDRLIELHARTFSVQEAPLIELPAMSEELQKAILALAHGALHYPEVRDLILDLHRVINPRGAVLDEGKASPLDETLSKQSARRSHSKRDDKSA